MKTDKCKQDID